MRGFFLRGLILIITVLAGGSVAGQDSNVAEMQAAIDANMLEIRQRAKDLLETDARLIASGQSLVESERGVTRAMEQAFGVPASEDDIRVDISATVEPQAEQTPPTVEQLADAVVSISCGTGRGSGVYLGDRLVLSCWHLFRGEGTDRVTVAFRDGQTFAGRGLLVDQEWDQSCIELDADPGRMPARLASANPERGDEVLVCGYDGGRTLRLRPAKVVGFTSAYRDGSIYDWFECSTQVQGGCSGGPVFDEKGEVVGNLWGSARGETTAVMCGRTRRFLLPWNTRLEAVRLAQWGGRGAGSVCQPSSRPTYSPAPSTTCPPTLRATPVQTQPVQVQVDYNKILDLMAADSRFRGPAGPAGPAGKQGEKGDSGSPGEKGDPGTPATVDVNALAAAIRAALPPITIATTDGKGEQVVLGEAYLGDTLTLPPITFHGLKPDGTLQDTETVPLGGRLNIQYPGMREKTQSMKKDGR
jgi:S1-C subfamily serine protease